VIEMMPDARSLRDEAKRKLTAGGVEHADRECRWIWDKVVGQRPITPELASGFGAAVHRRAGGEPLAHVLGEMDFRHLRVRSDRRALIPRPETEGLVDLVLERRRTGTVADIGTGTGCIALSLATEGEFRLVIGVEKCPRTLELARENFAAVSGPGMLVAGDLCRGLADDSLDVLVSNPPYLTDREYDSLDISVRGWEPEEALRSGPEGMDAISPLLTEGRRVVKAGGWIVLEVDCNRANQAARAAVGAGWSDVLVKDDLFGRARYVVARRSE
jgi:release factor glutamine methyltransferase